MSHKLFLSMILLTSFFISWTHAQMIVLRLVKDNVLEYQTVEETASKETISALKKEKTKFTQLKGKFKSEDEANNAIRQDQDITGFYNCWRCQGTGIKGGEGGRPEEESEEESEEEKKPKKESKEQKCDFCKGKKHLKGEGYAIIEIKAEEAWGYALVRKEMLPIIPHALKRGMKGKKIPTIKPVKQFKPGEFDKANESFEEMKKKAEGKTGFQTQIPGVPIQELTWPNEFFAS